MCIVEPQVRRALITGGAGFIGRALVARCLARGYNVTVIDNLCAGHLANLQPFLDRIEFFNDDILDPGQVRAIMRKSDPTIVFHLAAHHFIPFCNAHPQETMRVNVEGTHVVLSEAAGQGVATSVVASSGSLYPGTDGLLGEDIPPAPVDVYGLSKHLAEVVAGHVAGASGMKCIAARLFNAFGPCETNPHLIPDILSGVREGDTVRLGNIHTRRDYIFVDDIAEILCSLAERVTEKYTAVNVGTGTDFSAAEIVELVSHLIGRQIKIDIDPARVRPVDKLFQRADTGLMTALTNFAARHSLAEGMRKLLVHERLLAEGDA